MNRSHLICLGIDEQQNHMVEQLLMTTHKRGSGIRDMNCSICNKLLKSISKWHLYIHDTMSDIHQKYLKLLRCKSCNGNDWVDERISEQTHKLTCKNDGYVKYVIPDYEPLVMRST